MYILEQDLVGYKCYISVNNCYKILLIILQARYYYPYFTDQETEVYREGTELN